ncbi:MAG TPA: energy transducer TonB [Sphingomicrobium sp.]|nr:energy transducer TonB [Sphingomicrobium sp.]
MYRSDLNAKDKSGALVAVAAVHAALLFALLHLSGRMDLTETQSVLRIFDVNEVPPPPPEPIHEQAPQDRQKPKEKEGAASPANIRSQATEIVDPKPRISLPVPVPVETSETPRQGTQATQGATNVVGPGTGAGGTGTGTGSGGSGSGTGGGGGGGVAYPPRLVTSVLTGRDFPRELLRQWPRTPVFLRLHIDPKGYISECTVDRGTGVAAIDSVICNIAHDRLRFRPALDKSGRAVAGWVGYAQPDPR